MRYALMTSRYCFFSFLVCFLSFAFVVICCQKLSVNNKYEGLVFQINFFTILCKRYTE